MKPEVEAAVARVTEAIAAEHRKWSMHGSEPEVRVEAYDLRTLVTALREAERDAIGATAIKYQLAKDQALVRDLVKDAGRLNEMDRLRICLTPEYEGGWTAEIYQDGVEPSEIPIHAATGRDVRAALDSAIAKGGRE